MAKNNLTMDCISVGNCENDFDDNGLQHAFLLASWKEIASSDSNSQNDAEDCELSHYDTVPTGGDEEESTEVVDGERKCSRAVILDDKGGTISYEVTPETVGLINDEEYSQLRPEDQANAKRGARHKCDLEVSVCHTIKKDGPGNVSDSIEIRSREVEANEAKARSRRSAKDGGCLRNIANLDIDIHSSVAYCWAIAWAKISFPFSASLAIGILILMPTVGVGGDLTSIPVNTLVAVGNTARINCSTDTNQSVYWARALTGSGVEQWLYYGFDGFHSNNADERFIIDKDEATGRYDLIIAGVKKKDAGKYACVGESGLGTKASAELVVSDPIKCTSNIPSDGVMGNNVFDIQQDFIQISCSLTYAGNLSPTIEWSWPGSDVQHSAEESFVASTIKLSPSKEFNGVTLQCKANIEGTTKHTIDGRLQWKSEAVIVKYAAFALEELDACPGVEWNLVCNPQCSYSFEETKDHECRCLYTYYDKRTQNNYNVSSYAVKCANDNNNFRVVLITVAAVCVALFATLAITAVFCLKNRSTARHPDKAGLSQVRIGDEAGKSMLEKA